MLTWVVAFVWLVIDQLSKHILPLFLTWYRSVEVIPGLLRITLVKNQGAAFGLMAGRSLLFIIVALAFVVFLVIKREALKQNWLMSWGGPIAAAGALGNAIDRLLFGYVIDFIDVPFFSIFNIADIGIVVGIALLSLGIYLTERKQKDGVNNTQS